MNRRAGDDAGAPFRREDYARFYRRQHPLAIWFSIGIAFIGLLTLFFPNAVEQSATYNAIPDMIRKLFNVAYAAGGILSTLGLLRVDHRLEAAGMAILASVLAIQYISILYVAPASWASAMFVLALAIGCGRRSWVLAESQVP